MRGREFLKVADTLCQGGTEADWRSAVSRAYYAAFHCARELLELCGFVVPRADQAHAYLWLRLGNCQAGGKDLLQFRNLRNRADYEMTRVMKQQTALDTVRRTKDIVQLLDSVPATSALQAQITTAMKDYEQNVLRVVTWKP